MPVVLLRTCGAFARATALQRAAEPQGRRSPPSCAICSRPRRPRKRARTRSTRCSRMNFPLITSLAAGKQRRRERAVPRRRSQPRALQMPALRHRGRKRRLAARSLSARTAACRYRLTELGALECETPRRNSPMFPTGMRGNARACARSWSRARYLLDAPVSICVMVNFRQICRVGEGACARCERLPPHGLRRKWTSRRSPRTAYSLYADYFWYELGDMICIGDRDVLYYCFPQGNGDVVPPRTRLAPRGALQAQTRRNRDRRKKRL